MTRSADPSLDEMALRRSEERLRLASEALPGGVYDWDVATDRVEWSPAVVAILGYAPDEAPPDWAWWMSEVHPNDRGRVERALGKVFAGIEPRFAISCRLRHRTGHWVWVQNRGRIVRDEAGRTVRVVGFVTNIDKRKRADEALRQSEAALARREQELKTLAEHTPDIVWRIAPDMRLTYANPAAGRFLGIAPDLASGRPPGSFNLAPDLITALEKAGAAAFATGVTQHIDFSRPAPPGTRHYTTRLVPERNAAGAVMTVLAVTHDITQRRLAEEALAREKATLQTIIDAIPVMLVMFDQAFGVLRVNRTFEVLTGWSVDAGADAPLLELMFPEAEDLERIRHFIDGGETGWLDIPLRTRQGEEIASSCACIHLSDETLVWLGIDVSERKVAEERLQLLTRELAHRVKNQLAVMQSIVGRTLTPERPVADSRAILLGRLRTLAHAQEILTSTEGRGVPLQRIVIEGLAPVRDRVTFSGPDFMLNASAAQNFAMIMHELVANAQNYGAFVTPEGTAEISWVVETEQPNPVLRFRWQEKGGPPIESQPERYGFGLSLLNAMSRNASRLAFLTEGFVYEAEIPLAMIAHRGEHQDIIETPGAREPRAAKAAQGASPSRSG